MFLRFRFDAVVFSQLLFTHFDHCSRRFSLTDDFCFEEFTVVVGEFTVVVGEFTVVVGEFTEVVGELAEVVGAGMVTSVTNMVWLVWLVTIP